MVQDVQVNAENPGIYPEALKISKILKRQSN
jgi:hypothetical protein